MALDLTKSANALKLSLEKSGVSADSLKGIEVGFAMDVSGSFMGEHAAGYTQLLLNRFMPWAMVLDANGKADVLAFSSGVGAATYVGEITAKEGEGFIKRKIINKVPGYGLGTLYAPVIEMAFETFGYVVGAQNPPVEKDARFDKRTIPTEFCIALRPKRALFIVFTDGENQDVGRTQQVLEEADKAGYPVFVLFVAIEDGSGFPFLKRLAKDIKNTGLLVIDKLQPFLKKTDDELNQMVLTEKVVTWLKK